MKLLLYFLYLRFIFSTSLFVTGFKIPFTRRAVSNFLAVPEKSIGTLLANAGDDHDDVGNIDNIRYTTTIKINGKDVHVALDTGSTDLWVIPPGGIGKFNDSGVGLELLYGDGTYGVRGTIGVAPFEFGSYKVEKQAFLLANESSIGLMTELGIYGLFGLGFNDPESSPINSAILEKFGPTATWGSSVLENIFNQDPSKPNFIGVDLARTDDLEDTAGGSFNIGEYDQEYVAVASAPKLFQYPRGGSRWTTLLDGIMVNGYTVTTKSTINGTPAGKVVALVDTGSPAGIFTTEIMENIFSRIPGAVYDQDSQLWIVPCNSTANVELVFGDQTFPIHPLDLTVINTVTVSGKNYTVCTGSFSMKDQVGGNEFDVVLGDTFLRNVYTVYDFGDLKSGSAPSNAGPNNTVGPTPDDSTSDKPIDGPPPDTTEEYEDPDADPSTNIPYMQFLSQTDPFEAATEHLAVRAKALSTMGPELLPSELLTLLGVAATVTDLAPDPSSTSVKTNINLAKPGDDSGTSQGSESSAISRYAPVVIGLLVANLLVGLVLAVLGILACVRRGKPREVKGKLANYVPVKLKDDDGTYDTPYSKA